MSNPVTIQNHVYSGFTSGTEVVSTSFAYGIPAWVTVRIYEASDPDTNLTFNELSAGTFEVSYEPGMPANGTLVVVLDVPYAELVREVKDGQVFKEDTLENLLQQSIMATATILEGRFPSVSEPFNMGGFKITDMADPTNAQDAVTKAYGTLTMVPLRLLMQKPLKMQQRQRGTPLMIGHRKLKTLALVME